MSKFWKDRNPEVVKKELFLNAVTLQEVTEKQSMINTSKYMSTTACQQHPRMQNMAEGGLGPMLKKGGAEIFQLYDAIIYYEEWTGMITPATLPPPAPVATTASTATQFEF